MNIRKHILRDNEAFPFNVLQLSLCR